MAYVAIRIDEEAARVLNQYAAERGMTKSQAILSALKNNKDEGDALLDQLDKQSETYVDPLIRDLEPDELPECCQSIYGGSIKDRCEHWVDKRPAGFYNTLTHKWASDPDYYKYV